MYCQLVVLLPVLNVVSCAKILGYFPTPSISHQVIFQPIWRELSLRGHEVTIITPNPLKDPKLTNLTEIDVGSSYELMKLDHLNFPKQMKDKQFILQAVILGFNIVGSVIEDQYQHNEVKAFLNDKYKKFDMVLLELIHPLAFGLAGKYNATIVGISSMMGFIHDHDALGNPSHPILTTDLFLNIGIDKSFIERLRSVYYNLLYRIFYYWYLVPRAQKMTEKYLGKDIPYVGDIENKMSLMLLNTNPILNYVRPNLPNIVQLGQMHIQPKKPLPSDIQEYLDNSKEGVIYFSLGSNVKGSSESVKLINAAKEAFRDIPYNVLWKWETDFMPNKPDNVFIKKWFPQQDILGHPNVKVFITQGGLQSVEEAIVNAVPLVVLPFIADQPFNAKRMVDLGIAEELDPFRVTKTDFKKAVLKVITDKKYKENVNLYQKLLSDNPMTGLERGIWWIEYMLRHKGAPHLKSPATKLPLYQYFLLDVIAVSFVLFIIIFLVLIKILSLFIKGMKYIFMDRFKEKTN